MKKVLSALCLLCLCVLMGSSGYDEHNVFITAEDRKKGSVTIPASVIAKADKMQVWLIGENRYGRLKQRQDGAITSGRR